MSPQFLYETGLRGCMFAAREYLENHHLEPDEDTLIERVVAHIQATLPAAGKKALESVEAIPGLENLKLAVKTFGASMAMAGIEAAKEAGRAKEVAA